MCLESYEILEFDSIYIQCQNDVIWLWKVHMHSIDCIVVLLGICLYKADVQVHPLTLTYWSEYQTCSVTPCRTVI